MSGTHSMSSVASVASQAEHVKNPSTLQNFERVDTVIAGLLSGLYRVINSYLPVQMSVFSGTLDMKDITLNEQEQVLNRLKSQIRMENIDDSKTKDQLLN